MDSSPWDTKNLEDPRLLLPHLPTPATMWQSQPGETVSPQILKGHFYCFFSFPPSAHQGNRLSSAPGKCSWETQASKGPSVVCPIHGIWDSIGSPRVAAVVPWWAGAAHQVCRHLAHTWIWDHLMAQSSCCRVPHGDTRPKG
jgi:hypothetical protein